MRREEGIEERKMERKNRRKSKTKPKSENVWNGKIYIYLFNVERAKQLNKYTTILCTHYTRKMHISIQFWNQIHSHSHICFA